MKTAADPPAASAGKGAGEVLVSRQWLAEHIHDPLVRVVEVDVSPAAYNDGHIDGAVLWNVYGDLKDADYRTADADALQRLIARSGISPQSTVVFYGYAPALGLWLMRLYGHRDVQILDCSRDTWRTERHPWTTAVSQPPPGTFRPGAEDPHIRADRATVLDAIGRPAPPWSTCAQRPSTAVSASAVRRIGTRRPGRARAVRRPPARRRPLPP